MLEWLGGSPQITQGTVETWGDTTGVSKTNVSAKAAELQVWGAARGVVSVKWYGTP